MSTINTVVKAAVEKAAKELLVANNTVTTLELKLKLIKDEPLINWKQTMVSDIMKEFYNENKFTFVDNGTFRVYSAPGKITPVKITSVYVNTVTGNTSYTISNGKRGLTKGSPTALAAGAKAAATRAANKAKTNITPSVTITKSTQTSKTTGKTISRKIALDLMKGNKGKIFSAVFTKKDGSDRVINAQYLKDQKDMSLGYVKVIDNNLRKKNPNDCTRNLNLQTLKQLKIAGATYKVK